MNKLNRKSTSASFDRLKKVGPPWQLQTAKARFSELFRLARTQGPQLITRQGKEGVVMIPAELYDRLLGQTNQPKSLLEFFRKSPFVGLELEFERERDTGRDIDL